VATLEQVITGAAAGHPAIALLEGEPGIGKEALLNAVRLHVAGERPEATLVEVFCYRATGSQDPFGPLAEVLQLLTQHERQELARDALAIIREHGPELLGLIPGIGSTLSAAAKLGSGIVGRALSRENEEVQARWESLPLRFEDTIAALARRRPPLALVMKDAHWIDPRSAEVLLRLARRREECPVAVVLSLTPVADDHPLRELQREAPDTVRVMRLQPFTEEEIAQYIVARYGLPLSPDLGSWLLSLSHGKPLYVEEYLDLLEEQGVIRVRDGRPELVGDLSLVERRLPQDVTEVLQNRVSRVDLETRRLLQLAAVHGQQFLSAVLADLGEEEELEVVQRLEEVERQYRLVSFNSVERLAGRRTALYVFESGFQQTVYEGVSRYRQLVLHHRIAESLERFIAMEDPEAEPPRKWVLEAARHYAEADEPLRAAQRYLRAAQSAFGDGGFAETVAICEEALALVRMLPRGPAEQDRLRAEVIQLLLDATATWRPVGRAEDAAALMALTEEAEAAAARVADPVLQAHVRYSTAKMVLRTGRLEAALDLYREALSLAQRGGDKLGQLMIMSDLGHALDSADLAAGRDMVRRAYDLFARGEVSADNRLEERLLPRHVARLKGHLGVAELDTGRFGEAERWLTESVAELRAQEAREDLAWSLNFAGQLWTAAGRFEQARQALEEAVALASKSGSTSTPYHLALLGKLHLEWDRQVADAETFIEEAARTIPPVAVSDLGVLVRNVHAEFLLLRNAPGDIDDARRLLEQSLEEADVMDSTRSAIAARSLLARVALTQGDLEGALEANMAAVEALKRKGWFVPTVRSEEVLFTHHRLMLAAARQSEAEAFLRHAAQVLEAKAASIPDPQDRRQFLERVPLSREITDAERAVAPK
jgi:tetratricopeptide (TPR) repeat protein